MSLPLKKSLSSSMLSVAMDSVDLSSDTALSVCGEVTSLDANIFLAAGVAGLRPWCGLLRSCLFAFLKRVDFFLNRG